MALPTGTIINYSLLSASPDFVDTWYLCNGQSLPRSTEPELFAAIGSVFGHQDSNSFLVPDLRGYFVRGVDQSPTAGPRGVDPDAGNRAAMGQNGNVNSAVGSVQESAFRAHVHGLENTWGVFTGEDHDNIKDDSAGSDSFGWLTKPSTGSETRATNAAFSFLVLAKHSDRVFPVNAIVAYAGRSDPEVDGESWLICDGRPLPNGQVLPDLRGQFLRGNDSTTARGAAMRDPDAASRTPLPGQAPTAFGSTQADAFGLHQHDMAGSRGETHDGGGKQVLGAPGDGDDAGTTDATDGGSGKETRPINAYLHYIIRVK